MRLVAFFQRPQTLWGRWAVPPYCQSPERGLIESVKSVRKRVGGIGRPQGMVSELMQALAGELPSMPAFS